jgi:hypothetical protein
MACARAIVFSTGFPDAHHPISAHVLADTERHHISILPDPALRHCSAPLIFSFLFSENYENGKVGIRQGSRIKNVFFAISGQP